MELTEGLVFDLSFLWLLSPERQKATAISWAETLQHEGVVCIQ